MLNLEQNQASLNIKNLITEISTLSLFDPNCDVIIQVDASQNDLEVGYAKR